MRAILCLPLLLASYAAADEVADRAAIERTIAALNQQPRAAGIFTEDASSELDRLPAVTVLTLEYPPFTGAPADFPHAGPTVTISHEPMGEATITLPGMLSLPPVRVLNPRIANGAVRFLTPDVALTDGTWTYKNGQETAQTVPLMFVMKREGDAWKIAYVRLLASR